MTTPILGLTELIASQSQPHIPINDAFRALEAVAQLTAIDQRTSPAGGAADGDTYLVGASATGDWSGHDHDVALATGGGWQFFTPREGWLAYLQSDGNVYAFDGAAWSVFSGGGGGGGGNVTPDTHPSSPNALDDEFEAGTLDAKWADANIGSVTKTLSRGAVTISIPTEASGQWRGIEQTLPAGNWRVESKISHGNSNANGVASGWAIRENSSGKLLTLYREWATSQTTWSVNYWTGFNAFSANIVQTNYSAQGGKWADWEYYAIEYDGTNYYFEMSTNGVAWRRIATVAKASYFTADRILIGGFNGNSATTVRTVVDWFRRVS